MYNKAFGFQTSPDWDWVLRGWALVIFPGSGPDWGDRDLETLGGSSKKYSVSLSGLAIKRVILSWFVPLGRLCGSTELRRIWLGVEGLEPTCSKGMKLIEFG